MAQRSPSSVPAWPPHLGGRVGLLALVIVAALVVVGPRAFPGRTPIPLDVASLFEPWRGELPPPRNALLGDPFQQLTTAAYSAEAIKSGRLPMLNPHVLSGHPVAGDSIAGPFNPLQFALRSVLDLHASLQVQVLLQLVIAGAAMAWWVFTATGSRRAGAIAAVAWVMAGYQQVWQAYVYHLASLMWVPVVVVCWEKAARGADDGRAGKSGWAWAAAGGIAAGLCAHGGQVQIALYAALVAGLYAVCAMLWRGVPPRAGVIAACVIGVIGALIAAPTLLPALAQASDTVRAGFSSDALRGTALPAGHGLTALAPWLFGDPVRGDYVGEFNTNEFMIHAGIVPLLLALVVPFARRDRLGLTAAVMVGSVALITLGWIGSSVQAALPLVRYFGVGRWVAVWPMAVAFAAGVAVASVEATPEGARRLRAGTVAAAAALAAVLAAGAWWVVESGARDSLTGATRLASTLWPGDIPWFDLLMPLFTLAVAAAAVAWWCGRPASRVRYGLLVIVVMLDLGTFAARYAPAERVADAVPAIAPLGDLARAAASEGVRVAPESGDAIVLGPGVAPLVGLDTIDGYSSALQGSYARFVAALSEPTGNGFLEANPNVVAVGRVSRLLAKLLNVGYVLRAGDRPPTSEIVWDGPDCSGESPPGAESAGSAPADVGRLHALAASEVAQVAFSAGADGLHRVDVFARSVSAEPARATLTLTNDSGAQIANEAIQTEAMADSGGADDLGAPITTYFARQAESAEGTYTATLVAEAPLGVCVGDDGRLALDAYASEQPLETIFESGEVRVYRVPDRLGAAWAVPRAVVVPDQQAALAAVTAAGFDPATTIVIESAGGDGAPGAGPPGSREFTDSAADTPGSRGISDAAADLPADRPSGARVDLPVRRLSGAEVVVDVSLAGAEVERGATRDTRWVAVSQAYAPGWQATVDGAAAPVVRAYGGILAVPVPQGAGEIRLTYAPREVRQGMALGALGLVLAAGLVGAAWVARRTT